MDPIDSLAAWARQIVLRRVAVDFHMLETEQMAEIERQAKALEAEGNTEAAEKLRNLLGNGLRQLEGPKRGRPRKSQGGEL